MSLKKLVEHFADRDTFPISVDDVATWLVENGYQDNFEFHLVEMDPRILRGLVKRYYLPSLLPYNTEPALNTVISVSRELNDCWRRFVFCKELVHILDDEQENTCTVEDLRSLTQELTQPTNSNVSTQCIADNSAKLKALTILAPLKAIEALRDQYNSKQKTSYDIAMHFRIPVVFVDFLFSDYYKKYYLNIMSNN